MPERARARALRRAAAVAVLLAVAAAIGTVRWSASGNDGPANDAGREPAALAVSASSLYQFDDLAAMVAASDLVVRARVDSTARGRVVGDGEAAVISRIDTLEVEEVLAGDEAGSTLLVEEEGWLGDGTAIAVDGLAPSEAGMDAIWFLDRRPDPEVPGYLVINHQGRYVVDGDRLQGADGPDPLVAAIEPLGPDGLMHAVREQPAAAAR
jgi:hypothetical protein